MKKKKSRLIAWILAIAMVITVLPTETVHAAGITQSNDYMKFYTPEASNEQVIDINGKYNGNWLQTTYRNVGYEVSTSGLDNATLTVTPTFVYGGRFVEVTYKLTATGGAVTNGKLGLDADVQIGSNDYATVTLIKEGNQGVGFQMIDERGTGACFQFYYGGKVLNSPYAATTYWMGTYSERKSNIYDQVSVSEVKNIDSGIALSWQNINLAAGESVEYKIMLGIGTQKDLEDALSGGTDYSKETIKDLEAGNYKITTPDGTTYYFNNVTTEAGIPLTGTDANGKSYDFTGKQLTIVKVAADGKESDPSDITVAPRPEKPAAIADENIDTDTEQGTVTIRQAGGDQEYILVPEGTEPTEEIWKNAQKTSDTEVCFDKDSEGNALDTSKKYVIYTRKYATNISPKSETQGPTEPVIFHHHTWKYTENGSSITLECTSTEKPCEYHSNRVTVSLDVAKKVVYSGVQYQNISLHATQAEVTTEITNGLFPGSEDAIQEAIYYTDAACKVKTTPEANGADRVGGAPKNAGTYWVEMQVSDYTMRNSFVIEKQSIAQAIVKLKQDAYEPTGSEIQQEIVQVTLDGTVLGAADYTVDASSILRAQKYGTYTVKLTGTGNYKDSVTTTWQILDTKAPTGRMTVAGKTWTTLLNELTFRHFFKNTKKVTITADDGVCGSGVADIAYLIADSAYTTKDELEHADWQHGSEFEIRPSENIYLYARLQDNAGNVSYISSEGIVLYEDSVLETTSVTYVKETQTDKTVKITRNGNTIQRVMNTTTGYELVPGTDYEETTEGIVLKASYMQGLDASGTAYELTVSYRPHGKEYVNAAGNEKPLVSRIKLTVKKAEGRITNLCDLTKTYDGTPVSKPTYTKVGGNDVTVEYKCKDAEDSTYTTEAPKAAGTYVVRVSVGADDNYTAAEATREFRIYPRAIVVSGIQALDKTYDGTRSAGLDMRQVTLTNVIEGDELTVKAVGAFETKAAGEDKQVEIRELTLAGKDCENYRLAAEGQQKAAQASILRKAASITADSLTKHADMPEPELTYQVTGLVAGDTLSGVSVMREAGEDAGTYEIQVSVDAADNSNYTITTVNGTFTIEAHDWNGAWIVTKEATTTENGRREKVCQVAGCGHKEIETIPKIGTTDDGPINKQVEVKADSPVQEGSLDTKKSELLDSDKIFTKEEKQMIEAGADARVWLEFAKTDENLLTEQEKGAISDAAKEITGDALKMVFFDVNLYKQVAGGAKTQIFEAGMPLKVTIKLPDELINTDNRVAREYRLVRLHNGKVDILDGVYQEATGELTFETDQFSTFAIIYKDVARTQSTIGPQTGDAGYPMLALLFLSIGILGCAAIFRKRWSI